MKKGFRLCLMVLFVFLLASCNELDKTEKSDGNTIIFNTKCKDSNCSYDQIPFSLDKGDTWQQENQGLINFDIWDIKINKEVSGMVFFYATSYKQFLKEVNKNRDPKGFTYDYPSDKDWDELLNYYDEEYFEDNIVLFYYKYEPNVSENNVYNVTIKDNALTLNVNRLEGMLTAVSGWIEFITIKKEDVEGVNEFNVIVRTVSELKSSIVVSAKEAYIRDIYMNGLTVDDFDGVNNLKSIKVWTSGLMLDIHFNQVVSDEKLKQIINAIESSNNVRSIGYTSNSRVRIILENKFYDQYKEMKLTIGDVLDEDDLEMNNWNIEIKDISHIVLITLEMEQHGRAQYEAMLKQLKELDFPFIYLDDINAQ